MRRIRAGLARRARRLTSTAQEQIPDAAPSTQPRGIRTKFVSADTHSTRNWATHSDEGPRGAWLPDAAAANALLDSRARARQMRDQIEDVVMNDGLQFLRINDVCRLLRISKPTLWRLRRAHNFPEPTEVTDRLIAWRRYEVEEWLSTRQFAGRGASTRHTRVSLDNGTNDALASVPLDEKQQKK